MRDWSGPWTWAFQFQDQCISIYPLVSQVLLSAYYMLGPWFPTFLLSSAPEEFDTRTSVTKPHSNPDSHPGETGKSNKNLDEAGYGGEFDKATQSAPSSLFTPTSVPCLKQACTTPNCFLWSLCLHSLSFRFILHSTTDVISLNHYS